MAPRFVRRLSTVSARAVTMLLARSPAASAHCEGTAIWQRRRAARALPGGVGRLARTMPGRNGAFRLGNRHVRRGAAIWRFWHRIGKARLEAGRSIRPSTRRCLVHQGKLRRRHWRNHGAAWQRPHLEGCPLTAHVLISGVLFREPEQRTSKAGKPFVTTTIRAKDATPRNGGRWSRSPKQPKPS
jgi:hypothetical protein